MSSASWLEAQIGIFKAKARYYRPCPALTTLLHVYLCNKSIRGQASLPVCITPATVSAMQAEQEDQLARQLQSELETLKQQVITICSVLCGVCLGIGTVLLSTSPLTVCVFCCSCNWLSTAAGSNQPDATTNH
jgi:hypothetical protein